MRSMLINSSFAEQPFRAVADDFEKGKGKRGRKRRRCIFVAPGPDG
jgi:hypothetical protein